MKRYIYILILIPLFTISKTNAQNVFGVKAGLNFSSWNTSINGVKVNNTRSLKMMYGGFVNHRFSEKVSLQTELLYQQMGVVMDKVSYDQSYVYVPVILNFDINELVLSTGFQVGKLLSAKSDFGNIQSKFNQFDYQFILGSSYVFSNHIELELRYGLGLNNIASKNVFNILNDQTKNEIKNNSIGVSLNYSF
jgi:hypothetical protein